MIAWVAYCIGIASLLAVAAEALQRVLHARGQATRFVWAGSLLASVVLPLVLPLLSRPEPILIQPSILPSTFTLQIDMPLATGAAPVVSWPTILIGFWVAASLVLLLWAGASLIRLARARRRWQAQVLAESDVLISENTGPAVIGFVRPAVVIPRWVCALSQHEQRLVLAHEREHISAHDPLLMLFAQLVPVLLPWNPAVWLQARRLREAVELDCDARLLARGTNANRYAELLLDVGSRGSSFMIAAVTLSEPRSLLEKRIRRMFEPRPRRPLLQAASCVLIGAGALVLVAATPRPGEPAASEVVQEPFTVAPKLRNADDTKIAISRAYPPLLREAGIEGQAIVAIKVSAVGNVTDARVKTSTGHEALDAAAIRVARQMKFTPARNRDKMVSASIDVPVTFATPTSARLTASQQAEREKAVRAKEVEKSFAEVQKAAEKLKAAALAMQNPVLANSEEVRRATERYYPPLVRDAGIEGSVGVRVYVDPSGRVIKTELLESGPHPALDDAALRVAQIMTFEPSPNPGEAVRSINTSVNFRRSGPALDEVQVQIARQAAMNADINAGPTLTPFTVRPGLTNADETARALQSVYPPLLRDAGVGGVVKVWFLIDENGQVAKLMLKEGSGHAALDDAALKVAAGMKFSPAMNRDQRVKVWVDIPIVFKSQ